GARPRRGSVLMGRHAGLLGVPLALALALASSCAPIAGPVDVEVLVPDDGALGSFRLEAAALTPAADLARGTGELFDVRAGVNANVLTLLGQLREEELSFDDVVARARQNDGEEVAPRLFRDGDRYVAEDFDSLQYLTLFHNFERAWTFARAI